MLVAISRHLAEEVHLGRRDALIVPQSSEADLLQPVLSLFFSLCTTSLMLHLSHLLQPVLSLFFGLFTTSLMLLLSHSVL